MGDVHSVVYSRDPADKSHTLRVSAVRAGREVTPCTSKNMKFVHIHMSDHRRGVLVGVTQVSL